MQLVSEKGELFVTGKYWGEGTNRKNAKMFGDSVGTAPRLF